MTVPSGIAYAFLAAVSFGASTPFAKTLAGAVSPVMLPIPGTSKVSHLEENLAAASLRLDPAEVDELTQAGAQQS